MKDKVRTIGIFTTTDRAMHLLLSWALEPIIETTTDTHSFAFRPNRGVLDAHAYLFDFLEGEDAPKYIVYTDIKSFYYRVDHKWLIENAPIDKKILTDILASPIVSGKKIKESTGHGISLGSSLSPFLANLVLEGLQKVIYLELYGTTDPENRKNGDVIRFADDIIVTVDDKETGGRVLEIINAFLEERNLSLNYEKSGIHSVYEGFDFMSWHYQKYGDHLVVTPSRYAIERFINELKVVTENKKLSQREMILKLNQKLNGWIFYHRYSYAEEAMREVDKRLDELLMKSARRENPGKYEDELREKYWIKLGESSYFALPNDKRVCVRHLSDSPLISHEKILEEKRAFEEETNAITYDQKHYIETVTDVYRYIDRRQKGRCAICGAPISQEEKRAIIDRGDGELSNLVYIHERCKEIKVTEIKTDLNTISDASLLDTIYKENYMADNYDHVHIKPRLRRLWEYIHAQNGAPFEMDFITLKELTDTKVETLEAFMHTALYRKFLDLLASEGYLIRGHKEDRFYFEHVLQTSVSLNVPKEILKNTLTKDALQELRSYLRYLGYYYGL